MGSKISKKNIYNIDNDSNFTIEIYGNLIRLSIDNNTYYIDKVGSVFGNINKSNKQEYIGNIQYYGFSQEDIDYIFNNNNK